MDYDFSKDLICVKNRILPKDPLRFFQNQVGDRITITITNDPHIWQDDMCIAERLFSHLVVLPVHSSLEHHSTTMNTIKHILKDRLKYPNIKENPELLEIAKTWILPNKLHMGPNVSTFTAPVENPVYAALAPLFGDLNLEPVIHYLKIEVPNGFERNLVYTVLDNGFRPSLLLVKWLKDIDEDNATAQCNGHLQNAGYRLISLQNGYALYYFTDQCLYDACSFKSIGLKNPLFESILESATDAVRCMHPLKSNDSDTKE